MLVTVVMKPNYTSVTVVMKPNYTPVTVVIKPNYTPVAVLIKPNYTTTCFDADHYHHQGRFTVQAASSLL